MDGTKNMKMWNNKDLRTLMRWQKVKAKAKALRDDAGLVGDLTDKRTVTSIKEEKDSHPTRTHGALRANNRANRGKQKDIKKGGIPRATVKASRAKE